MNTTNHKILIIGAKSKTAQALVRLISTETPWDIVLVSSSVEAQHHYKDLPFYIFDYTQPKELKNIFLKELPSIVINTAAMTNVDKCELEHKAAWDANVLLVEYIARMCKITDTHLIHLSTDYIFDGAKGLYAENDTPNPISYYGKTKLASENVCIAATISYTIIRTNVVYGFSVFDSNDFVEWTLSNLDAGKQFSVVTDQISNPTLTDDIALAVIKIIKKKRNGIYHVAGADWISRLEFAKTIATVFHFDPNLILPILTESLSQKAKRPFRGGLLTLKAQTDLQISFATAQAGLTTLRHHKQLNMNYEL
jgi:dTDP-4-dehydrorhamnose reductase